MPAKGSMAIIATAQRDADRAEAAIDSIAIIICETPYFAGRGMVEFAIRSIRSQLCNAFTLINETVQRCVTENTDDSIDSIDAAFKTLAMRAARNGTPTPQKVIEECRRRAEGLAATVPNLLAQSLSLPR
jgi:hypothetical protein